jgi:3-hydroxybutyryl-CoA dehydrogenase
VTGTRQVGVIGAGRMGTGIAYALLLTKTRVTLSDADSERVEAGVARVHEIVDAGASRGSLDEDAQQVKERLTGRIGLAGVENADLVIEAVPEVRSLKTSLLADLERLVRPDTVIASNTSSISIDELAGALERPERFLGMHFFNPVPASRLVEIVLGARTDDATAQTARDVVEAMGKAAVVVQDSPGFASSRLGVALGLEAIRMVQEGVASPQDIDAAMTLGYKHPVGPLRLTDMVGLDVRLDIAEYLASTLGPRFEPPQLMRDMVRRGELGQKSGQGFYTWER